jgi:hypothetical protein
MIPLLGLRFGLAAAACHQPRPAPDPCWGVTAASYTSATGLRAPIWGDLKEVQMQVIPDDIRAEFLLNSAITALGITHDPLRWSSCLRRMLTPPGS